MNVMLASSLRAGFIRIEEETQDFNPGPFLYIQIVDGLAEYLG